MGTALHLISADFARDLSHAVTVSRLCGAVARELKMDENQIYNLRIAGFLHDIGKLELVRFVYGEEDTLTVEQMRIVRMHAQFGSRILREQGYPEEMAQWVLCHHENCDGSGYPRHLHSDEIPMEAKIIRVCDVFAALTANRLYRRAFDADTAVEMMIAEAKFYDIGVFLAFLRVVHSDELLQLLDNEARVRKFKRLIGEPDPGGRTGS